MPILYSAVACDQTVISTFASCGGNFKEILEQVLLKISNRNNKMTYSHGQYLFHYAVADTYLYFCVTDKKCQRSRAFLFLNEIQRRFVCRDKSDFSEVLAAEMYRYSEDYNTITIRKGELDELNKIAVGCSESILGEKILYVNNTENLSYSKITFVGKPPEQIVVTFKTPKLYAAVAIVILAMFSMTVYYLGPVTTAILLGVSLYYIYKSFL